MHLPRLAAASLLFVAITACSANQGSAGAGAAGGASGAGGQSGGGAAGGAGGGLVDAGGGGGGGSASVCSEAAKSIYVVSQTNQFYRFDPPTLTVQSIGNLQCPS